MRANKATKFSRLSSRFQDRSDTAVFKKIRMSTVTEQLKAEDRWAKLASRMTKVALAKKDLSYKDLAALLTGTSSDEENRRIKDPISRGTIKLSTFLKITSTIKVTVHHSWREAMPDGASWEDKASHVVKAEIAHALLSSLEVAQERLSNIGCGTTARTLPTHMKNGTIALSDFLQLLCVLNSHSADNFVEPADLTWAAQSPRRKSASNLA
ncbi:DUF6471 domain-containing protein [Pandoraea sputorum]|uniref:DUF6471 domain-containing protein n=1 Tax=Pandoraea sputorum TaxID=93222 RepID=UPI001E5B6032|nr:DUF6471 domain-containing protein [Pandoraea sputorum]MCE4058711.1 DUF6471 domain-containing protein [Pandoraea sputorum]